MNQSPCIELAGKTYHSNRNINSFFYRRFGLSNSEQKLSFNIKSIIHLQASIKKARI